MPRPSHSVLQSLGWLIGLLFAVTGWVSHFLGYVILLAMLVITARAIWRWFQDVQDAVKERDRLRAESERLKARRAKAEQERDALKTRNTELEAHQQSPNEAEYAWVPDFGTGTEQYPWPRPLSAKERTQSGLSDRSFRLTDLVQGDLLRDKTFHNCTIHGPAIILFERGVQDSCTHIGNPDSLFLELKEGSFKTGLIKVDNCVFMRCTFIRIAMAGTPDDIRHLKAGFNLPSEEDSISL